MKKFALLIVVMFSCTDPERATKALMDAGYTKIEITGHSYGCSDDDSTCTGFTAIGPTGRYVEGAVGCGRGCGGKGCTVRLD